MALTTLASQTQETLSKIHETIVSFTTDTSKRDARLEELEQDCKKYIQKLQTAFAEESSALEQKRKAEKDAVAEQRKKEDEERERKRQLEDEEMAMKAKKEDEKREEALKREKKGVKDTTETLKAQAEAQMEEEAQRRWEERNGRLKELREEINRLIEEQLQMPLPLPERKSIWAAETSPRNMPMITSLASAPPVAVESKTLETLPVAAVETQPMSNPVVKAHEDDPLPASEKSDVSARDIDMDSSLETLPRTTYSPDPAELSFAVPPVKISLTTDAIEKEEGERAVVEDESNALGVVSRSLPLKQDVLDVDEDEAIAHMSELRRVNSRDPSAERRAQLGVDAGAGDHGGADSESEYDQEEETAAGGGRPQSESAELAWWEQQQRKNLESGGDVQGQVPEEKAEQSAAQLELPKLEVLERATALSDDSRRPSVVDEKPLAAPEDAAEVSTRSSPVAERSSAGTEDSVETSALSSVAVKETFFAARELNSDTKAAQVSDTKDIEDVLRDWDDVKDNDHDFDADSHANSESDIESEPNPGLKRHEDTGSFSPRPSRGDWPRRHDSANIDEAYDASRNPTPELKIDTDMFNNKEPQVAPVNKTSANIEQAQAQATVDSVISPTSTVERGFQTTSVATPISHIERMSKTVHDELDMVESSPVDVISMGSPFERGSSRSGSFDTIHDQDHDHSQLTADTSAVDVDAHPQRVDREAEASVDVGSGQISHAGDKADGDWSRQEESEAEPTKRALADAPDHGDSASAPDSVSDNNADDWTIPEDLEPTQNPAAAASDLCDGEGKPDSVATDKRTESFPTSDTAEPVERVAADVSDHDDMSDAGSVSGNMQVDVPSARENDPKPAERALFDASERPDVGAHMGADVDALDDQDSDSGWGSEDDDIDRAKPASKSLSEELAQDDSSEDPETLYDDDPLAVGSPDETVNAESAVQADNSSTLQQQQDGNKDVEDASSLLRERPSDEAVSKEQSDEKDDRGSVPDGEGKGENSKPMSLSEELAQQEREAHGDDLDSSASDWEEERAKDADLHAGKKKDDASMDAKADAGPELNAPSLATPTEKDAGLEAEADVEGGTVATPAVVVKETETVPGVEVDAKAETIAPPPASSAEKDAVTEVEVYARVETVAPISEAPTRHAEEVADAAADKPEILEIQQSVSTQERIASRDVNVMSFGELDAFHSEQVSLPVEGHKELPASMSDSEHEDKDSDIKVGEETAKAVGNVEVAHKLQALKDISPGENLQPPATGFTDGESQEFFTPMPSAGLRSPSAGDGFLGKDTADQATVETTPRDMNAAEVINHQETLASQSEQNLDEISDQRSPSVSKEPAQADKLDQEIKADEQLGEQHDAPAVEDHHAPVDASHVSTSEIIEKHPDPVPDINIDGHENELAQEPALNKVPTNETHSTNETNEQDSNNGYASSQHEVELEDGYSATVHGQDDLFDSDEHTSGEDRDSGDEQYDKDATPIDNVENPFRDSAEGDDLDDLRAVDSDDHLRHDGFEFQANLSVVERDSTPRDVATSRGYSWPDDVDDADDMDVTGVDDDSDRDVQHDGHEVQAQSPALQRNTQTDGQDQVQDEWDNSVAPEAMPAIKRSPSESQVDTATEETKVTEVLEQQVQQESSIQSSVTRESNHHDVEDEIASDYEEDRVVSEQHVSRTIATSSSTEAGDVSYGMDVQQAVPPEPVSPTATRGLAASRHNPERVTERPQTPEANPGTSSSMPQNPFEGHDDADLDMENFAPRDVTNISWSSQATTDSYAEAPHAQFQSRSRRDTDIESTPMSLHSASTLSSAPSSPVHASLLGDNHEPVIRDSWPSHPAHGGHAGESSVSSRFGGFLSGSGRPRGDSHLSNVSASEYMRQDVNPSLPVGGGKGSEDTLPLGPSPMRLWQRRDQGLADDHRPVSAIDISTGLGRDESDTVTPTAVSASATTVTYRNSITGSGSGSGSGSVSGSSAPSLFQRMRSVFENNSSASASATTPSTSTVGGSRSNSPVVRSRPGSFYRSLEQHQQEQLAAKRLSGGLVRPGDVAAAYDRGHGSGHGAGYEGGDGSSSTCGYDEVAGYLHHEHTTKTSRGDGSRRRDRHSREEYYDDDQLESDDDSGEDASLLEHGGAGGEYSGHGYGYDRHGRLTTAN